MRLLKLKCLLTLLISNQSWGPVVEKLDPNHHASHRLFLDATVVNGDLNVKDLKVINRALEKVLTGSCQCV